MKAFTTLASAAALALCIASASHAAVIADFTPDSANADYKWIHNGNGGEFISVNATTDTTAQGVATHFSYLTNAQSALAFLPATFTIDATATNAPATQAGPVAGNTYTQTGLNGSFSFIYSGPTTTIDGFHLVQGVTNLLSGVFTDAWIQGNGGSGSTNVTIGNGGSATYSSSLINFAGAHDQEFAFNLLNVSPHFGAPGCPGNHAGPCNATGSLNTFTANGGGNFSSLGVPEPATWGLMIVGFAGVGAMVRNRRRALATA